MARHLLPLALMSRPRKNEVLAAATVILLTAGVILTYFLAGL